MASAGSRCICTSFLFLSICASAFAQSSLDLGVDVVRETFSSLLSQTLAGGDSAVVTLMDGSRASGASGAITDAPLLMFNTSKVEGVLNSTQFRSSVVVVSEEEFFGSDRSKFFSTSSVYGGVIISGKDRSRGEHIPLPSYAVGGFSPAPSSTFNPAGLGLNRAFLPQPVVKLLPEYAAVAEAGAIKNEAGGHSTEKVALPPFSAITMTYDMSAMEASPQSSDGCLRSRRCMPIGGVSVLAMPSIDGPIEEYSVAAAAVDATAFIHSEAVGAVAASSNTAAMMGVADAFGRVMKEVDGARLHPHKAVFAFLTGEAYGGIGTKAFIRDTQTFFNCTSPWGTNGEYGCRSPFRVSSALRVLRDKPMRRVVEVSQVGDTSSGDLYLRSGSSLSSVSAMTNAVQQVSNVGVKNAGQSMAGTFAETTVLKSFEQFKNKSDSWELLQITGYNSTFSNKYFHSSFDSKSNIQNSTAVCAAALASARLLASSVFAADTAMLAAATAVIDSSLAPGGQSCALVQTSLECLTGQGVCEDAAEVVSTIGNTVTTCNETVLAECGAGTAPKCYVENGMCKAINPLLSKYSGVYRYPAVGFYQPALPIRYIHHKLGRMLGAPLPPNTNATTCSTDWSCGFNNTCSGTVCESAFVRYIDAVSPDFTFVSDHWEVKTEGLLFDDGGEAQWTESNWYPLSSRHFYLSSPNEEIVAFAVGVTSLVVSFIFGFALMKVHKKEMGRHKQE